MPATIIELLVEKWETRLDELQRIDPTSPPPREAMDVHDDADVSTLERLPKAALDVHACMVACGSLMLRDAS
tara:strand:- start:328 stop:543 length:216 start_codon:yes stop_codon:yes gene_type:complete